MACMVEAAQAALGHPESARAQGSRCLPCEVCGACGLKARCTNGRHRFVSGHLHEDAFRRMQQRATPEMMRLRRSTVEHPFAFLKYRIFGHPHFLLRGLEGTQTEISLAVMVYNLKRLLNVLGGTRMRAALGS